jgi:hypothetical protein
MDQPRIELTLKDFPEDLQNLLREYFSETYPDTEISFYYNPLEKFSRLPPELLTKVIRSKSELRPSSHFVSKTMREQAELNIYEVECSNTNPTEKEKTDEILSNSSAFIYTFFTDAKSIGINIINNPIIDKGNVLGMGSFLIYQIERKLMVIMKTEIKDLDIGLRLKDIFIDMFSRHNILSRRRICMKYNNKYANQTLVDEYNSLFSEYHEIDVDEQIKLTDFRKIILANNYARILGGDLEELDGRYPVGVNSNWKQIRSTFITNYNTSRDVIMTRIIELTGAIIYEDDPYKLIL